MHRSELIEWIVIMLCVVLFWPILFWSAPEWYRLGYYLFAVVSMLIIFFRRFARMRAGLKYSEDSSKNLPGDLRSGGDGPFPPGPR